MTAKKGDMVWNTLVIVTVMLPLMGLSLDIPRYFILRNTLQNATDAAAEAAAQTLDAGALINAGDAKLSSYAAQSAAIAFSAAASPMTARGYHLSLDGVAVNESANEVSATAHGDIRYLFGLTPAVTLHASGKSRYRSIVTQSNPCTVDNREGGRMTGPARRMRRPPAFIPTSRGYKPRPLLTGSKRPETASHFLSGGLSCDPSTTPCCSWQSPDL